MTTPPDGDDSSRRKDYEPKVYDVVPVKKPQGKHKSREQRAAEAKQCFDLRVAGQRIDQISLALGISEGTVVNRLVAGAKMAVSPSLEAYRAQQDARLDAILSGLLASIPLAGGMNPQIAMALVRVEERRAKLHGLDAPTQVRLDGTITEVSQQEREMADLLAQAERDNKLREHGLNLPQDSDSA